MMALITHQAQGSCPSFALRPKPWSKGVKLKSSVSFQSIDRTDKLLSPKHRFHIRVNPFSLTKGRTFKVSSFKGNAQNDESEGRDSFSRFSKSPVQLSCTQEEKKETISESSHAEKHSLSYASEGTDDTRTGSLAIQKLFRKWLMMLLTPTNSPRMDENFSEAQAHLTTSESEHVTMRMQAGEMLKAAMVFFLRLDVAISLPLLIFIPWYLAAKVVYGAEVTKELTPLWVLGPLIVGLYIKIIQGLCSLYAFCFLQAVRLVKNLPRYYLLVYSYIAEGKLKAFLWTLFWKPIVDTINLDYKQVFRQKGKRLKEWAVEKYLDYIESIWPYYCRTIRFLKKANLI